MFEIGEVITCCEARKLPHTVEELNLNMPFWVVQNEDYTVRGFNENDGIVVGVLLEEIVNPILYFKLLGRSQEGAFRLDRFRKKIKDKVTVEKEVEETVVF